MATVEGNIEAALLDRVRTLVLSPALPVAWPNRAFKPPAPGAYLRVDHLPNRNDRFLMGGADPHHRRGILQVTVISPLNQGPSPATKIAGEVAAHFPADLALYLEDIKVTITEAPSGAPAFTTDVSWNAPVSIRYECFA
jgi:hypothetical protein